MWQGSMPSGRADLAAAATATSRHRRQPPPPSLPSPRPFASSNIMLDVAKDALSSMVAHTDHLLRPSSSSPSADPTDLDEESNGSPRDISEDLNTDTYTQDQISAKERRMRMYKDPNDQSLVEYSLGKAHVDNDEFLMCSNKLVGGSVGLRFRMARVDELMAVGASVGTALTYRLPPRKSPLVIKLQLNSAGLILRPTVQKWGRTPINAAVMQGGIGFGGPLGTPALAETLLGHARPPLPLKATVQWCGREVGHTRTAQMGLPVPRWVNEIFYLEVPSEKPPPPEPKLIIDVSKIKVSSIYSACKPHFAPHCFTSALLSPHFSTSSFPLIR